MQSGVKSWSSQGGSRQPGAPLEGGLCHTRRLGALAAWHSVAQRSVAQRTAPIQLSIEVRVLVALGAPLAVHAVPHGAQAQRSPLVVAVVPLLRWRLNDARF